MCGRGLQLEQQQARVREQAAELQRERADLQHLQQEHTRLEVALADANAAAAAAAADPTGRAAPAASSPGVGAGRRRSGGGGRPAAPAAASRSPGGWPSLPATAAAAAAAAQPTACSPRPPHLIPTAGTRRHSSCSYSISSVCGSWREEASCSAANRSSPKALTSARPPMHVA